MESFLTPDEGKFWTPSPLNRRTYPLKKKNNKKIIMKEANIARL